MIATHGLAEGQRRMVGASPGVVASLVRRHAANPNAAVVVLVTVAVVVLQWAPGRPRDITVLGLAIATTAMAFGQIRSIWLYALATVPVFHLVVGLFDEPKFSAVRLVLSMLLIPAAADVNMRRGIIEGIRSQGGLTFGLFVMANVVAAGVSGEPESIFRSATYLEPLLFFLFTYAVVRRKGCSLEQVIRAVVIGGWIVAGLGIVEIATQQAVTETLRIPGLPGETPLVYLSDNRFGLGGRIMSTIGQPVYAGMYFGLWTLACGLLAATQPKVTRGLWLVSAAVGAVLLLETGSRGPLLALVAASPLLLLQRKWKRQTLALIGIAAISACVVALFSSGELMQYFGATLSLDPNRAEAVSLLGRVDLTSTLLEIFRANPIFGFGPGLIQKAAFRGDPDFLPLMGLENQYAVILADAGIFAGATYLLFMITTVHKIRGSQKQSVSPGHQHSATIMLTMFAFYFFSVAGATCMTHVANYVLIALYGAFLAQERNLVARFAR